MTGNLQARRIGALLIDALGAFFIAALISLIRHTPLGLRDNLVVPLVLMPVAIYFCVLLFGRTPGQWVHGLIRVHARTGERPYRLYDLLFESDLRDAPTLPLPAVATFGAIPAALAILTLGAAHRVASYDPTMRAWKEETFPLFAPDPKSADWRVLPFYYSTGAWPVRFEGNSILYSLPYEKGPPERFVGKIGVYWNLPEAKITLLGPLTLKEPASIDALKACFLKAYACVGVRRDLAEKQLRPFFERGKVTGGTWFQVENPLLKPEEKAQGLYLQAKSRDGSRIFEAYYLVNAKLALQGILLERSTGPAGAAASERLRQVVGSIRMQDDLAAPTAWVNQQLARVKLRPGSRLEELKDAQGILLAKISVDPRVFDSFYHLGGLGMLLYREAQKSGDVELAASSKLLVQSTYRFGQDVDPKNPKLRELETFKAQVEQAPR